MSSIDRRRVLKSAALLGGGLFAARALPAWAQTATTGLPADLPSVSGDQIRLVLDRARWPVEGRAGPAITINGTLPGPVLRLKEGQTVRLAVENRMDEEASIHWHGVLVPFQMDGVPGVTFPGIAPHSTFTYEFEVKQNGTYWYHSHSAFQEQAGLYGPIVIEPKGTDPVAYDREHVIVLSDYSYLPGRRILEKLKQEGGVFNYQRQTVAGLLAGQDQSLRERIDWAKMLMDPTDISDVTAAAYTFLVNGHGPKDNWTGLFKPGERVRLRFINASSMSIFDVRIDGLPMTVVQAHGNEVEPVAVDTFRISVAETYDVIVTPQDRAYTLFVQAEDRSGFARGTLAPRAGMAAPIPPMDPRPMRTRADMGMEGMEHGEMPGMTLSPEGQ